MGARPPQPGEKARPPLARRSRSRESTRLSFWGQMVMWRKLATALQSAKKGDQWVQGWPTREKARPTPLLAAVAGLGSSWWVHSEGVLATQVFRGKWCCGEKPAALFSRQKRATNGCTTRGDQLLR